jgi:hypothetical protein
MNMVEQMRDWVADCMWANLEDEEAVADLSNLAIIRGVRRHYMGGLDQFCLDS